MIILIFNLIWIFVFHSYSSCMFCTARKFSNFFKYFTITILYHRINIIAFVSRLISTKILLVALKVVLSIIHYVHIIFLSLHISILLVMHLKNNLLFQMIIARLYLFYINEFFFFCHFIASYIMIKIILLNLSLNRL